MCVPEELGYIWVPESALNLNLPPQQSKAIRRDHRGLEEDFQSHGDVCVLLTSEENVSEFPFP
jgi:hypothetical protein